MTGDARRFTRIRNALAAVALAVGVWPLVVPAGPAAADPPGSASPDAVYRALGIDEVPADYVVLVDTSMSMRVDNRYGQVKQSLRAFFAALAPQDQVTLIPFDTDAHPGPAIAAGHSPDALVAQLPPDANGDNTDIGKAIEAGLGALERPNAPGFATLVLLTDGEHAPATGSPYPYAEGYAWDALARRAADLHKDSFNAYAIPLTGATGARLLRGVFKQAQVLDPAQVGELTTRLETPKRVSRAAKARLRLGDDPTRPVEVGWPVDALRQLRTGTTHVTVTLHSTAARLPLILTGLTVSADRAGVRVAVTPNRVDLEPGQRTSIDLAVTWSPGSRNWWPSDEATLDTRLSLHAQVDSSWSRVLDQELGIHLRTAVQPATGTGSGRAQLGRPGPWTVLGLVIVVLGLVGLTWRWLLTHPVLDGELSASRQDVELGSMAVRGRRVRLADSLGLPGRGTVRGRRVRLGTGPPVVVADISYSPDRTTERRRSGRCAAGRSVLVNGIRFGYAPSGTAAPPLHRERAPWVPLSTGLADRDAREEPSPAGQ